MPHEIIDRLRSLLVDAEKAGEISVLGVQRDDEWV
jgi:hypothetical protein